MRFFQTRMLFRIALACAAAAFITTGLQAENVWPEGDWAQKAPAELGMDAGILDELAESLGGRGCVIKDGYVVKSWGDQAEVGDWLSSAKPVLSTLLFFAIEEGKVKSVDQPIAEFGWDLRPEDQTLSFRHLGAMNSGYARPEGPGQAWAYNDFAIMLYQMTLFDKVFQGDAKEIAEAPERLGALGLQDGLKFNGKRRIYASVRDFARIVWLWTNHGKWNGSQLLPEKYFTEYMTPQTAKDLPQTAEAETDDYLGIGSYGGGSDHFSNAGPGIYGFNWWFNDTGRLHPYSLTWPDAPKDTIMSLGAGGNSSAFIPSRNLALVCAKGDWGNVEGGNADAKMNQILKLLAKADGYEPRAAVKSGGKKKWQPVTLSFRGPESSETNDSNPFTAYKLTVTFAHGDASVSVPGYYAADGNAGETGAESGHMWRVLFAPDATGTWNYAAKFTEVTEDGTETPAAFNGLTGAFQISEDAAEGPGFMGKGTLRYTGGRYWQFAETGEYFLKGGADSPENFLAFADIDGTKPTHLYEPHAGDWKFGDPVWRGGKGKNIIGALNYLAGKGMNNVYFLTMNVEGDGKDVWPWTSDKERFRFDCSKLDQWNLIFDHMDRLGILLHVVLQEQENDQLLDGGELGPERKLYFRELIARFAHHPALVWNLGEENTNTPEQRRAFAAYIRALDPYGHPIVIHTFPSQRDEVYTDLLGYENIDGPSLQLGHMEQTYDDTLKWVNKSREAGRPWVVCLDEIGPANTGVKPDADDPDHDDVRRYALWGNLMAGGSGAEWLFGYKYAHNDINLEDWRSRDLMWDQTRYALEFFHGMPFYEMEAVQGVTNSEEAWCFAKAGEVYAVYAPDVTGLTLTLPEGRYSVAWFNPKFGGALQEGAGIDGGAAVSPGAPPEDRTGDWAILLRRKT